MTIKNKRKHARRVLLRNKSLIERMMEAEHKHNIAMFNLQQETYIALEELKHQEQLKLNEYKKQAEASI